MRNNSVSKNCNEDLLKRSVKTKSMLMGLPATRLRSQTLLLLLLLVSDTGS